MISEFVMVVPPNLLKKIANRLVCTIPEVGIQMHDFPVLNCQ
jgi:hypothetical protein